MKASDRNRNFTTPINSKRQGFSKSFLWPSLIFFYLTAIGFGVLAKGVLPQPEKEASDRTKPPLKIVRGHEPPDAGYRTPGGELQDVEYVRLHGNPRAIGDVTKLSAFKNIVIPFLTHFRVQDPDKVQDLLSAFRKPWFFATFKRGEVDQSPDGRQDLFRSGIQDDHLVYIDEEIEFNEVLLGNTLIHEMWVNVARLQWSEKLQRPTRDDVKKIVGHLLINDNYLNINGHEIFNSLQMAYGFNGEMATYGGYLPYLSFRFDSPQNRDYNSRYLDRRPIEELLINPMSRILKWSQIKQIGESGPMEVRDPLGLDGRPYHLSLNVLDDKNDFFDFFEGEALQGQKRKAFSRFLEPLLNALNADHDSCSRETSEASPYVLNCRSRGARSVAIEFDASHADNGIIELKTLSISLREVSEGVFYERTDEGVLILHEEFLKKGEAL